MTTWTEYSSEDLLCRRRRLLAAQHSFMQGSFVHKGIARENSVPPSASVRPQQSALTRMFVTRPPLQLTRIFALIKHQVIEKFQASEDAYPVADVFCRLLSRHLPKQYSSRMVECRSVQPILGQHRHCVLFVWRSHTMMNHNNRMWVIDLCANRVATVDIEFNYERWEISPHYFQSLVRQSLRRRFWSMCKALPALVRVSLSQTPTVEFSPNLRAKELSTLANTPKFGNTNEARAVATPYFNDMNDTNDALEDGLPANTPAKPSARINQIKVLSSNTTRTADRAFESAA